VIVSEFVSLDGVMEAPEKGHFHVLLGGGRRLFDRLPQRIELEQTGLTETDGVTHLAYRVVR